MRRALTPLGVLTPDGFASTADAHRAFMCDVGFEGVVRSALHGIDINDIGALQAAGSRVRSAILAAPLPSCLVQAVCEGYRRLEEHYGADCDVAVRSSATAEDLPDASSAGQQQTFLNIGKTMPLDAVRSSRFLLRNKRRLSRLPSKCSLSASASTRVWWTIPSR